MSTFAPDKESFAKANGDVEVIKACEVFTGEPFPSKQVGPYYDTIPVPSNGTAKHPDPLYETVFTKGNERRANLKGREASFSAREQHDISLTPTTDCPAYRCTSVTGNYYKRSIN